MLYIHLCNSCNRFHILNGHKDICPICEDHTDEMDIPYINFVQMTVEEREVYRNEVQTGKS